jgi:hypothetical protein
MKLEPKHHHSEEIQSKTYDLNSEISYGINSAQQIIACAYRVILFHFSP